MHKIRNSAKAIIIKDNKVLLTKNKDAQGIFYLLPGGGQNPFETMKEALVRECLEEISAKVKVNNLRFIREYIGRNHEFSDKDFDFHQVEYMFECELIEPVTLEAGHLPDDMQIGVSWVKLNQLDNIRLYPRILKEKLINDTRKDMVYLGDVN